MPVCCGSQMGQAERQTQRRSHMYRGSEATVGAANHRYNEKGGLLSRRNWHRVGPAGYSATFAITPFATSVPIAVNTPESVTTSTTTCRVGVAIVPSSVCTDTVTVVPLCVAV